MPAALDKHTYICISIIDIVFSYVFFNHFKMGLWEIKLYTEDKTRMKKGNKEWAEINCLKNIQRDKMTYLVLDSIIYCRLFLHHYNSMKNHEVHVY